MNQDGAKYRDIHGNTYDAKPEHLTQLHGNLLVPKNHPRIRLRGKLDSFQAAVLEAQMIAEVMERGDLLAALDEVLSYCRALMTTEVLDRPFDLETLLGLREDALREISHEPGKHLGVDHFIPERSMGVLVIALNALRAASREMEIAAIDAFCTEEGTTREDLLRGYNRLSSALYILSCKELAKSTE